MNHKPEILFEDKDLLICRKPAGIATQTKCLGQQDMESFLKNYRVKKGEPPYIGIIHRLDQPVEGVMVFAKNQKAAAGLSKQVQERVIGKYYYAVSASKPKENKGVLENYLITDKKTNFTQVVEEESVENSSKEIKYAKLEYKVVKTKVDNTLFDIKLHTGRQHQIRVQMAHMGCPLVGDGKYNVQQDAEEKRKDSVGLALCSYKLEFEHPTQKTPMQFEIQPLGETFSRFFEE